MCFPTMFEFKFQYLKNINKLHSSHQVMTTVVAEYVRFQSAYTCYCNNVTPLVHHVINDMTSPELCNTRFE